MNNMGGYKSVTVYPVTGVILNLSRFDVSITASTGGVLLPISEEKSSIEAPDNGDGSYSHSAEIILKASDLAKSVFEQLHQICRMGALLVATGYDGRRFLFGDKDYPLTGTITEQHGTAHADLHAYRLSLSSSCLHPELLLI
jgi:hypothetical protein